MKEIAEKLHFQVLPQFRFSNIFFCSSQYFIQSFHCVTFYYHESFVFVTDDAWHRTYPCGRNNSSIFSSISHSKMHRDFYSTVQKIYVQLLWKAFMNAILRDEICYLFSAHIHARSRRRM